MAKGISILAKDTYKELIKHDDGWFIYFAVSLILLMVFALILMFTSIWGIFIHIGLLKLYLAITVPSYFLIFYLRDIEQKK